MDCFFFLFVTLASIATITQLYSSIISQVYCQYTRGECKQVLNVWVYSTLYHGYKLYIKG